MCGSPKPANKACVSNNNKISLEELSYLFIILIYMYLSKFFLKKNLA
jgi:hypothetical protein